jgi:hypothetical protein
MAKSSSADRRAATGTSPCPGSPTRVLLSARDPGATENIIQLNHLMAADPVFETVVTASGTASLQMTRQKISHIPFAFNGQDHIQPGEDAALLLERARALLDRTAPDMVVVSLSSLGAGIDEALIAVSTVPVLALQDAWGDVNDLLGKTADLYLVLDDEAREISRRRFGVRTLATGMPKYLRYRGMNFAGIKAATRLALGLDPSRKLVGWFGQSNQVPGYAQVFDAFVRAVKKLGPDTMVTVKPHPKFSGTGEGEAAIAEKHLGPSLVASNPDLSTEHLLAAADLVVTPFSLCGLDHAVMSSMSPVPLGSVVYLMNNREIQDFARQAWGRIDFPIVGGRGVGTCLTSAEPEAMADHFAGQMAQEKVRLYHSRSRQVLPRFDYDRFKKIVLEWK